MSNSDLPQNLRRTPEQLREHYEIEKELASRLKSAPRGERAALYPAVYSELFRRVPHHPQWMKKDPSVRESAIAAQVKLLEPYLRPETVFLEAGAGDCAISIRVASRVRKVYAVEVSDELLRGAKTPDNFQLVLSDGTGINLPEASVDVAYSFQLMEHIHPDDAMAQLREIHRVLKPGGIYFCVTPNRLSGPHDISRYFDEVATGLHLKEYSAGDLLALFRSVGFGRIWIERVFRARRFQSPVAPVLWLESILEALPRAARLSIARSRVVSRLLDVSVIGRKT